MQVRYQAALRPDRKRGVGEERAATIAAGTPRAQPRAQGHAPALRLTADRRLLGPLELREQRAHLFLQLRHEQLALRLVEAQLDLGLVLLALVQERASCAGDGVAPVVEQLLD